MATFRKHGKGWQVRVSWYDDDDKRHYTSKAGFKTKMDAKAYALELEKKKQDKTIANKSVSLVRYYKEWFETYKAPKIAPTTANRYKILIKVLEQYFGNKKIDKITRYDYQVFINEYGKNHAPDSVKKANAIIRSCVKSAILDDLINKDFTQRVELTWNEEKILKVEYLNVKEIELLISELKKQLHPSFPSRYMILTAIFTGMRIGEIAALTWKDIDFNWRMININKSWDFINRKFKKVKTDSSNRIIRVNTELLDILQDLKQNNTETNLVFDSVFGTVPGSGAVNKVLRKVLKQAGINKKGYHFHSLRHSHVALLLYYGVDIYAISKRLGHSDLTTTTRKYAYLIDEFKAKSDDHIEDLLNNFSTKKTIKKVQ